MPSVPRRRQFVASFGDRHTVPDAETVGLGRLRIHHSPDLPVQLIDLAGEPAALLGWPTRRPPAGPVTEAELGELAGSWVLLTEREVLPDPLGSYATVFAPDLGVVASTSALLPRDDLHPRTSLNRTLDLPTQRLFYPFGLTPWEDVHRLLPNHRLDLQTWQARRVDRPQVELGLDDAIERIAAQVSGNLSEVASNRPVMMGVTAGNETRLLLAGLKGAPDVLGFTFGTRKTMDTVGAARVARLAGIRWELRPAPFDAEISRRWFEDVGEGVAGGAYHNAGAKAALPSDRLYVKGMGGELGRASWYQPYTSFIGRPVTPEVLLKAAHLPSHPDLLEAGDRWLSSIDSQDASDLLDLHYWDNRIGAWAAPQAHADQTQLQVSYPFNQLSTIDAMRALPLEVKQGDRMASLAVARLWPELLAYPINQDLLWRRVALRGKRFVTSLRD